MDGLEERAGHFEPCGQLKRVVLTVLYCFLTDFHRFLTILANFLPLKTLKRVEFDLFGLLGRLYVFEI